MATPGTLNIVLYYGASHDLVIQFKDSDGNDFDISSYSDFTLKLYTVSSLTQIGDDIDLTRTGSQLDYTFPIADIKGYPSNMRHEILFTSGSDTDPVLRGSVTVTNVLKDDSISTSATVTLTEDTAVVTVSDVTLTNVASALSNASTKTPVDTDIFTGVTSAGALFGSAWSAIKTALNSALSFVKTTGNETIAGIKTFSSFPVTPSSEPATDYQVANKKYVDDNAGGGGSGDYDPILKASGYDDIIIYDKPNRENGALGSADSGQVWTVETGTVEINNNTIYASALDGNGVAIATLNETLSDFQVKYRSANNFGGVLGNSGTGLGFYVDADNYIYVIQVNTGSIGVYQVLSGTETQISTTGGRFASDVFPYFMHVEKANRRFHFYEESRPDNSNIGACDSFFGNNTGKLCVVFKSANTSSFVKNINVTQ